MPRRKASSDAAEPWAAALRLLTRRDYGTQELRQRLLAKGFCAEAVETAIARGVEYGYLDDARHIEHLVRTLLATGRAAGPRLRLELRRRGLPDDLIHAALAESRAADSENEALQALISRRFPDFAYATADDRQRRRVVAFLQRRGFPLDRILLALKRTDS